jgi:DNA polymerase V
MLYTLQNNKRFALVDCNNFYVSCERVFQPQLAHRPVVVLSNNDGCIISRSDEIKKIGIPMGSPVFKWKKLLNQHNTTIFSSNFPLYGDISNRIMLILKEHFLEIECYSIDEAFLNFCDYSLEDAKAIQSIIMQYTSIPVSIGIGSTKTLAKIANKIAKKYMGYGGIFDIDNNKNIDDILRSVNVIDIWGVGNKTANLLSSHGIQNGYQLKNISDAWAHQYLTVNGIRTIQELRGISYINLKQRFVPKKSISTTRTFANAVDNLNELEQAIATYIARSTEKLRQQSSLANCLLVFLHTNKFQNTGQDYISYTYTFDEPTAYTPIMIEKAIDCIKKIYKPGYKYKKIGVILTGIVSNCYQKKNMFFTMNHQQHQMVSKAVDAVNNRYGKDAIFFGAMGMQRNWRLVNNVLSNEYTTNINEIMTIHTE